LEIAASSSLSQPVHWIFHLISKLSKKLKIKGNLRSYICQGMETLQPNVNWNVNNIIKLNHSDAECNARIKASAIVIMRNVLAGY
jgi:hypothetical protein